MRPVPYYFVYTDITGTPEAGYYKADDDLGISGTVTIHDERGLPIDPIAVAAAFDAIVDQFGAVEMRELLSTQPTPAAQRQIFHIGDMGNEEQFIHLVDVFGIPHDGSNLENLTAVHADSGLFTVADSDEDITKSSGAPSDLRLGPATHGTLDDSFAPREAAVTLSRDFLRGRVMRLNNFLIGTRPGNDPADPFEFRPSVRHNETITFSMDGNATLGAANAILDGTPGKSLVVAPVIATNYDLPQNGTDENAQWPNFPPGDKPTDPIPVGLRDTFAPTAHFVTGTEADVLVTLNGFAEGHAVRVYNRKFLPDAREGRGDGAGGVADDQGQISLLLKDPLGLVERGLPTQIPADPTLRMDVVVVNENSQRRIFGNITAPIGPHADANLPADPTNAFDGAAEQSISRAGILGLHEAQPVGGIFDSLSAIIDLVLNLGDESSPRDAPRLPSMARRETIVATKVGNIWKGQISGMHLIAESRNAKQDLGSPGSPGGREFHALAVNTEGGRLAYDIARAALRRTRELPSRLEELAEPGVDGTDWTPPAEAEDGTISAAILQTISPAVETPELTMLGPALGIEINSFPATWAEFVDGFNLGSILNSLPGPLQSRLAPKLTALRNSPVGARLYNELKRELSSAAHGRRDAFWALRQALFAAREFIYIQGPAFADTDYSGEQLDNVVTIIRDQLNEKPGLHVILNLAKELDYGPGYEVFAAREYANRLLAINSLIDEAPGRIVAFHPMGFPGRALRLTTNVVVIDDVWAMVGTSTLRRRGIAFDGGLDMVFTDRKLNMGRSEAITTLRRDLMAQTLGVSPPVEGEIADPTWVRLEDCIQAFWAYHEMLAAGGAGRIEKIWDGQVPGVDPIDPLNFPVDDVADPDGRDFNVIASLIMTELTGIFSLPPP
jgi:hypothetical protein